MGVGVCVGLCRGFELPGMGLWYRFDVFVGFVLFGLLEWLVGLPQWCTVGFGHWHLWAWGCWGLI